MTFVTIELNKQMRKEVAGSNPVGGVPLTEDCSNPWGGIVSGYRLSQVGTS